jgi:DNA-binding NarL/FixJ family response regulator
VKVKVSHPLPIYAEALECLIEKRGGLEVAAGQLAPNEPAVRVAVDTRLTAGDLAELQKIRRAGSAVLVLAEGKSLSTEVAAAADAVVSLSSPTEEFLGKLSALGASRRVIGVSDQGAGYFEVRLSSNEQKAAQFLARGASNQEIAAAMGCSEQSVKNYMRQLMRKLGCKNRVQLLLKLSRAE